MDLHVLLDRGLLLTVPIAESTLVVQESFRGFMPELVE